MKISLNPSPKKADLLVLTFFKKPSLTTKDKKHLGSSLSKSIEARFKAKDFEGEQGQSVLLYPENSPFKKVLLLGRGDEKKQGPKASELLGGSIAQMAQKHKAKELCINSPEKDLSAIAYGLVLGSYEYKAYKKADKKEVQIQSVNFMHENKAELKQTLKKVEAFIESSALIRDLVNAPAGHLDTDGMVKAAQKVGKQHKLKVTVLDDKKLSKLGCEAIVGVGKGAEPGARLVILEYKHKSSSKNPDLAFVGKGIVFDTGGLNIKPTNFIETMKEDMAGAATVLGAMQMIAELKIPGHFIGVMACAENAVSGTAQHPGDVVKAYNGKTIEIGNTDAEGRLALADALSYTEDKYKPKKFVDLATLTGAVTVALGYEITGAMGNDEKWVQKVIQTARDNDERMWELPMPQDLIESCKGKFTDLQNINNSVRAGSSYAGAFLSHFIKDTPWTHLDIAGTAWAEKPSSTTRYGGTAVMLRTLVSLAEQI